MRHKNVCNSHFSVLRKFSSNETHPLTRALSATALSYNCRTEKLQQTVQPAKPNIFTLWPFTEECVPVDEMILTTQRFCEMKRDTKCVPIREMILTTQSFWKMKRAPGAQ